MDHSQFSTGEIYDQALPYYGEILTQSVAFGSADPKDIPEKRYGRSKEIVTDKLGSYSAALREIGYNGHHETGQYQNNQCERSLLQHNCLTKRCFYIFVITVCPNNRNSARAGTKRAEHIC